MSGGFAGIDEVIALWCRLISRILPDLLDDFSYPALRTLVLLRRGAKLALDDIRDELAELLSGDPSTITSPDVRSDVQRLIAKTAPSRSPVALAAVIEWLLRRSGAGR